MVTELYQTINLITGNNLPISEMEQLKQKIINQNQHKFKKMRSKRAAVMILVLITMTIKLFESRAQNSEINNLIQVSL
jgi:hypothetical protein